MNWLRPRILDLYITRKFLGTFFYAISLLILVVIIFDVSEKVDDFITRKAPLQAIVVDYYLNFIPFFINLFSSLFTFIAVIFFTSKLAARTEIVAILSSGISFRRLLVPYLVSASILAALSIVLSNYVIPITNRGLREFEKRYLHDPKRNINQNIHMQISPGVYVYVENFDAKTNSGKKATIETYRENRLWSKLMADEMAWDSVKNVWTLKTYALRMLPSDTVQSLQTGATLDTAIQLLPADFLVSREDMKVMTAPQLSDFIAKEELKGSSNVSDFLIEKYGRIAFPLSAIVLTVIGVALSSRKLRGGTGMHLGLGIAITFSYILLMQVTSVFSRFGNLSPLIAVWIPNLLFGLLAIYLLAKAPK